MTVPYGVVDGTTSASQVYAEDLNQYRDILTGQRDAGQLSLLTHIPDPTIAPTVTTGTGAITGSGYTWAYYWIGGVIDGTGAAHQNGTVTILSPSSSSHNLTSNNATVSISGVTPPTGAIGWGVMRTKSGGGTLYLVPNSQQFLSTGGSMPATYVDNTVDASLGSAFGWTNATGTRLVDHSLVLGRSFGIEINSTTTETSLINGTAASGTTGVFIPANIVTRNGYGASMIRLTLRGWYQDSASAVNTVTLRVKMGGTTLWGNGFTNSANNDSGPTPWALTAEFMSNGATQWLNGMVLQETGNPGGASSVAGYQTPSGGAGPTPIYFSNAGFSSINMTADTYLDATVQWAGGHGSSTYVYPIIAVAELL